MPEVSRLQIAIGKRGHAYAYLRGSEGKKPPFSAGLKELLMFYKALNEGSAEAKTFQVLETWKV